MTEPAQALLPMLNVDEVSEGVPHFASGHQGQLPGSQY